VCATSTDHHEASRRNKQVNECNEYSIPLLIDLMSTSSSRNKAAGVVILASSGSCAVFLRNCEDVGVFVVA